MADNMIIADTMADDSALPKHLWGKESKDLRNAIYDDWKRKAIDSAKKRAAAAHVDYPTFANLVSVAHLKPVDPKKPGQQDEEQLEHIYKAGTAPAWSFDPAGSTKSSNLKHGIEDTADGLPALLRLDKLPGGDIKVLEKMTDDVFAKKWRHLKLTKDALLEQMAFITGIDTAEYPEIFKVELPPNLLADILATICTCFGAEGNTRGDTERQRVLHTAGAREADEEWTVSMLEAISKCGRFSLAIRFVEEKTRAMVRALISHLHHSDWCHESDDAENPNSRVARVQNMAVLYCLHTR